MKKYRSILDIVLLSGMSLIVFLAAAPHSFVMPTSVQMLLLGLVLVLVASFLVMVWREQPEDERELQNQAEASRWAYFVGAIALIIALVIQSLHHHVDAAIPTTLLLMLATKIFVQKAKDDK